MTLAQLCYNILSKSEKEYLRTHYGDQFRALEEQFEEMHRAVTRKRMHNILLKHEVHSLDKICKVTEYILGSPLVVEIMKRIKGPGFARYVWLTDHEAPCVFLYVKYGNIVVCSHDIHVMTDVSCDPASLLSEIDKQMNIKNSISVDIVKKAVLNLKYEYRTK